MHYPLSFDSANFHTKKMYYVFPFFLMLVFGYGDFSIFFMLVL